MQFYRFFCFLFSQILILQFSFAATTKPSFNQHYVRYYSAFKTTHELAKAASKVQHSNKNLSPMIQRLLQSPPQKLPSLSVRGGILSLHTPNKIYRLTPLGGTRFLFDGERIDLNEDLSRKFFPKQSSTSFLIPEAHAIAPIWAAVVVVIALVGSVACYKPTIDEYFGTPEIAAKWVRPGEFNRYLREIKEYIKPICPGAAWADSPSVYDYEAFLECYCPRVQSTTFDETAAGSCLGAADEGDLAILQAVTQDAELMRACRVPREVDTTTVPGTAPVEVEN
jgi:hypothetical protein